MEARDRTGGESAAGPPGAPPGRAPRPDRQAAIGRRRLVLVGGLAAIAVVVVVIALTSGGDGQSADRNAAGEAVEQFVAAGQERDFGTACGLMTVEARLVEVGERREGACAEVLAERGEGAAGDADLEVEIVEVRVSGNRATVEARIRPGNGEPSAQTVDLEKTDAGWRIATFRD